MNKSVLILLASALLLPLSLHADTLTWTGAVSNNWSDAGNWSSDGANTIPNNGDIVLLTGSGNAPTNLDIANLSINGLRFDGANPPLTGFTLSGEQFTLTNSIQITTNPAAGVTWTIDNDVIYNTTSSATFQNNVTLVFDGVVSGTGRVGKDNGGTIVLSNPNNTFEGGVNANQGTIRINGPGTAGSDPAVFTPGFYNTNFATLWFSAPSGYAVYDLSPNIGVNFGGGGNIRADTNVELFLNGGDSNGGRFGTTGGNGTTGKIHVNSANNFAGGESSGGLNLSGGLTIMNNAAAFDGALDFHNARASFNGGTLDLNGHDLLGRNLSWSNNTGPLGAAGIVNTNINETSLLNGDITQASTGSGAPNFGGPGDIIFTGDILASSSTISLDKLGTGTLTLRGGHTLDVSRSTHIKGGTLVLDYLNGSNEAKISEGTLGMADADVIVRGNAAEETIVNFTDINANLNNITSGSNSLLVETNGQNVTVNTGNFVLDDVDTFNFGVDESGGGTATITSTATMEANGFFKANVTYNEMDFAKVVGGEVMGLAADDYINAGASGDLASSTALDFVNITDSFTTSSPGDNGELAFRGLRFNENQDITLTLDATVGFDREGTPGILVTSNVGENDILITGGTLDTQYNSEFIVHQYNTQGVLQIDSQINSNAPGSNFSKTGEGEVILTNENNRIQNNFNIYDGKATITNEGALGTATTLLVGDQATFNYAGEEDMAYVNTFLLRGDGTIESSGDGKLTIDTNITNRESAFHTLTVDGTGDGEITGNIDIKYGGVRKTGSGTWILSGANTYRGDTIIEAGTLQADGTFYADSDFIVESGARITGNGGIDGNLNLNDGSTVGPGGSVGTLSAGDTTFTGITNFEWEVNDFGLPAGTGHDLLDVNGTIDLLGSTLFNVSIISEDGLDAANWDAMTPGQWLLASTTDGILGFDSLVYNIDTSQFTNGTEGGTFSLIQDGNDIYLSFAPIPEPNALLLLVLGGLTFSLTRRRRANLQ